VFNNDFEITNKTSIAANVMFNTYSKVLITIIWLFGAVKNQ